MTLPLILPGPHPSQMSELQSELLVCHQELDRMTRINEVTQRRLQAAESAAQQAVNEAQQVGASLMRGGGGDEEGMGEAQKLAQRKVAR